MFCSNCGHELAPEAKFCSNCGAPVSSGAPSGSENETPTERRERERREDFERAWGGSDNTSSNDSEPGTPADASNDDEYTNEQYAGGFATKRPDWEIQRERVRDDSDDEWSMSDLGPARPTRRRTWLWVLLGTMAVIVIACCVFSWWLTTDSGMEWFEGIATQAAQEIQNATEEAATPQP